MNKKKFVKSAITSLLVFVLAFAFCNVAALYAEGADASDTTAASNGKVVYLNASQSGAGGDGSTAASAVKTLEAAYEALAGGDGTIVLCGNLSVTTCKDGMTSPFSARNGNVCITGKDPATGALYKATISVKDSDTVKDKDYIPFFTPTTFEYLTFDACTNYSMQFVTGPSLTFGEGMTFLRNGEIITETASDEIVVRLGDASSVITANYTQLSGAISSVYGGNEWQKVGNADNSQGSNIVISGSASILVRLECGGNKKYVSRTDLTIDENAKVESLNFTGYSNGNLKDVNVCISGGTVNTIFSQRESNNSKTNTIDTLTVTVSGKPTLGDIDLSRGTIATANLIFDAKLETDIIMTSLDEKWSSVTLGENVKLQLTGNAPIPTPGKVTMSNGSILYLYNAAEPAGIVKNGTAKVVKVSHTGHSLSKKEVDCGTAGVSGNLEHYYCADATCPSYGLRYLDEAGETPVSLAAVSVTLGHKLTHVDGMEATCAIAGVAEHYHCEVCGRNFADKAGQNELSSVVVARKAHDMTKVEQKAPTCTEDGVRYAHWHCSICNWNYKDEGGTEVFTFSVVEPKTGHGDHLKKVDAQAASCTQDGVTAHWVCEECGKLYTDAVYNGSRLELTAEQIVEKSDHTLIKSEAVAATKDATGSIEYWYCDTAGCVNYGRFFADAEGKVEITDKDSVILPKLTGAEEPSGNFPVILVVVIVAVVVVAGVAVVIVIKRRKV